MFAQCLLVLAALWSSGTPLPFPQPDSNATRTIMRLTGTFSVSDPDDLSLGSRFGGSSRRPSDPRDAVITFKNGDSIVSASPGLIDRSISQGVTQLAVNMDQAIGFEGKSLSHDQNVVFSPASISIALALALLGARGRTAQEVGKVLGIATLDELSDNGDLVHEQFGYLLGRFEGNNNSPTQISIANGVFLQRDYPINERFERQARTIYRSDIVPVDFRRDGQRAGSTINRWVEEKTFGRIKGFLPQAPSPDTQVLLANAIYFNGQWETPFPEEATRKRPFYVTGSKKDPTGEVLEVDMMAGALEVPYLNDPDLDCQLVGLPYKGGKVVMWVVLPNAHGFEGLNRLKARLTNKALDDMVSRAQVSSTIVSMPRMKLEATVNLRSVLQSLGVECLFQPRCSDLGAISSGGQKSRPVSRPSQAQAFPVPSGAQASRPFQGQSFAVSSGAQASRPLQAQSFGAQASRAPSIAQTSRATYRPPFLSDTRDNNDVLIFSSRFGETNENEDAPARDTDRRRQTKTSGWHRVRRQANPGLYVDDVIHKVEIEVTETGTVAAATTALSISRDGSHKNIRLDRPFLFFIRHEDSRLMLFWAAVVRPT